MKDTTYHPDDPLFLLSRSFDEPLTPKERKVLDCAVAKGELPLDDVRNLRAVDDLLRRWKAVSVVSEDLADLVLARLNEQSNTADETLDALLASLGVDEPEIDWNQFHRSVMEEVAHARPERFLVRPLIRIGAPLALAACLAFGAWMAIWAPSTEIVAPARLLVQFDPSSGSTAMDPLAEPRVSVAFGRASLLSESKSRPLPPISSGWAGATNVN
jgi:hypothetical protein